MWLFAAVFQAHLGCSEQPELSFERGANVHESDGDWIEGIDGHDALLAVPSGETRKCKEAPRNVAL
jgi:hypothetical protein